MSKASRRRQRPGTNPSTPKPAASPPPASASTGSTSGTSGTPGTAGTAGTDPTVQLPATPRATGTGSSSTSGSTSGSASGAPRPSSSRTPSSRAGRRERQRTAAPPTFFERYRTAIIVVAALAGVALLSTFVFLSASQSAYACSTIWTPDPTASPAANATPALGYVQPDMGRQHVAVGTKVTYTYCAPASGNHFNVPGTAGPIPARVYGPNDQVLPQGWIHNLEHGGIVILYTGNGPGATADGQAQLHALYDVFPNSPVCNIPKGIDRPGHRPVRPDVDAVPGHRLGPGPAARDAGPGQDPGLLPAMGREDQPGEAVRRPERQPGRQHRPKHGPEHGPEPAPSATPTAIPTATPAESAAPSN